MAKRKKIVRLSASTAARRKKANAKGLAERRLAIARSEYRNALESYRALEGNVVRISPAKKRLYPADIETLRRSLRAARDAHLSKRTPIGVSRDPATGQFVSHRDAAASPAYRAESRRVRKIKAKAKKVAKRAHKKRRDWFARTFKHEPAL